MTTAPQSDPIPAAGRYGTPLPQRLPASVRAAATVLISFLPLVCVAAVALIVFGLNAVIDDESSHTDEMDGLGTSIGLVVGGFGAVALLVAVGLLYALISGWRRAARTSQLTRLRRAGAAAAVAGVAMILLLLFVVGSFDAPIPAFGLLLAGGFTGLGALVYGGLRDTVRSHLR